MQSAFFRKAEAVSKLIELGADVNAKTGDKGKTALMCASSNEEANREVISKLIQSGADVNAKDDDGATVLMYAAMFFGDAEAVELLTKSGADVNAKNNRGETALMKAATHGNMDAVSLLLDHGADANIKAGDGTKAIDYIDFARESEKLKNTDAYQRLKNATRQE